MSILYLPVKLIKKDAAESPIFDLYLDILLNIDAGIKVTNQFFDQGYDYNFAIIHFPYIDNKIPISPAYGVY
jgi:hypothetical protein